MKDHAVDRLKRDLYRLIENMRYDLARIEILSAALAAFTRPVPQYEPRFQHLRQVLRHAQELN